MNPMLRRGLILALALSLLSGCAGEPSPNPSPSEEGENKVVLYASMREDQLLALKEGFESKYPDVTLEYYAGSADSVLTKISAEAQGRNIQADVIWAGNAADYVYFKQAKLLREYTSPQAKDLNEAFVDPDGCYTAARLVGVGIGYNTELVAPGQAPKTWEDLLAPKWKGKLALPDPDIADNMEYWLNAMMCNEDYGEYYIRRLRHNGCAIESGTAAAHKALAQGTYHVGICLDYITAQLAREGEPVDFVYPDETVVISCPIALLKGCPHLSNGKLLYDYILSREGQQLLADEGLISVRKDVEQTADPEKMAEKAMDCDLVKIVVADDVGDNLKTFMDIFELK